MIHSDRYRKAFNIALWLLVSFTLSHITDWNIWLCLALYPVVRFITKVAIAIFGIAVTMIVMVLIPIVGMILIMMYL